MSKEIVKQNTWDMIYLIACALHSHVPLDQKVQKMDLASLYQTAKFHTLTAITAMALESVDAFQNAEVDVAKRWKEAKEKAIRKNLLLDAEREQILQYMEHERIWYMPLKGSVLKDLYPKYGMRQMADNDILYDSTYQEQMLRFMQERGYRAESVGKLHHDAYEKPPVYNFELHTALFGKMHDPAWQKYYENVRERLIRDEGSSFGYHFRDEDFYIYLTTHACKHYDSSGTGLRSLVDTYIYTWKKGESLDWEYINKELKKLGIAEFERQCRSLAGKLFSDPEHFGESALTEEEGAMLNYFAGSGTYGTVKNRVEKKMKELLPEGEYTTAVGKLQYLWKRLFPDMEWFKIYEPFCYQHKWLIPFFYVYRVFRGILFRRKKLKSELHVVRSVGKEDV